MITTLVVFNSLAPRKFEWNFRYVIFKWILVIDGWGISYEIAPIWMSLDFTGDQSTLVQVMACCLMAMFTQILLPYGVTRPEWVNWLVTHYCETEMILNDLDHEYWYKQHLRR